MDQQDTLVSPPPHPDQPGAGRWMSPQTVRHETDISHSSAPNFGQFLQAVEISRMLPYKLLIYEIVL